MPEPQNYKNHAQRAWGFLLASTALLVNIIWTAYRAWQAPGADALVALLTAVALLTLAFSLRAQVLTVQDRVIRQEMRLRLGAVLPPDLVPSIGRLTRDQLVALRFASDAELPGLVREVLDGSLSTRDAIKRRVQNWQADYLRA